MLNKILREPLVHFLVAGFFLFVYFRSCSNDSGLEDTILIKKDAVLEFMQYQNKAFNADVFSEKLDALTQKEKDQMIQNYIQDEVLYREALKLGLDQNDFVIKRRIIQKMQFILDDFDPSIITIHEDSLAQYYKQYQDRYYQPEQYSFTHIFFKKNKNRDDLTRAQSFMENPSHQKLSITESLKYGDRFLYHRNYAEKSLSFLESQFGEAFIQKLKSFDEDENRWQGPLASKHGHHWIKLTQKAPAKTTPLKEIEPQVKSDYLNYLKKQHKQQQIQKLIDTYNVLIDW